MHYYLFSTKQALSLTSLIHTCKKINYTSCSLLYKFISYIIFITLYKFTSTEYFMGGGKGRKGHDYTKMTLVPASTYINFLQEYVNMQYPL